MQTPEEILNEQARHEAFNRGYYAAENHLKHHPELRSLGLRTMCPENHNVLNFTKGWMMFCDKLQTAEDAKATGDSAYRRRRLTDAAAQLLTWIAAAAALALVAIYAWGYYLRQSDIIAERQRREDLASRVHWLGNVTTYRYWNSPQDPRGNLLVQENRQFEIGLKPDGTVVWRAIKQKPLPANNANGR